MILKSALLFRTLSGYHYRTIIITVLLPAIGPAILASFVFDSFILRTILYAAAFLVWAALAVLSVATMLTRDRADTERQISQKVEAISCQISVLKEAHDNLGTDLRLTVKDLEETVRTTLKEELGVSLPRPPVSIRASFDAGGATISANLKGARRGWLARFREWIKQIARRAWEVAYGRTEDI